MVQMMFMTVIVGFLSYGCLVIIAWHYGLGLPLFHPLLITVVMVAGPPLQLLSTLYAHSKVQTWRIMADYAQRPQLGIGTYLARGQRIHRRPFNNKASLEYFLGALIWLGFASLPYWFGLPKPEVWLGLALCIRQLLRWALPK